MLTSPQSPPEPASASFCLVSEAMSPPPHAVSANSATAEADASWVARFQFLLMVLLQVSCCVVLLVRTGLRSERSGGAAPGHRLHEGELEPRALLAGVGGGPADAVDHHAHHHDGDAGRGALAPLLGAGEPEHGVVPERTGADHAADD